MHLFYFFSPPSLAVISHLCYERDSGINSMLLPLDLQFDPLTCSSSLSCTQNWNFFLFPFCLSLASTFVFQHSSIFLPVFLTLLSLCVSSFCVLILLVLLYPVSVSLLLLPFPMYQSIRWLNSSRFVSIPSFFLFVSQTVHLNHAFVFLLSHFVPSTLLLLRPLLLFFRVNETFESQSGKRKSRISTSFILTEEKKEPRTVPGCLKVRRMNAWVRQRPVKPIRIL